MDATGLREDIAGKEQDRLGIRRQTVLGVSPHQGTPYVAAAQKENGGPLPHQIFRRVRRGKGLRLSRTVTESQRANDSDALPSPASVCSGLRQVARRAEAAGEGGGTEGSGVQHFDGPVAEQAAVSDDRRRRTSGTEHEGPVRGTASQQQAEHASTAGDGVFVRHPDSDGVLRKELDQPVLCADGPLAETDGTERAREAMFPAHRRCSGRRVDDGREARRSHRRRVCTGLAGLHRGPAIRRRDRSTYDPLHSRGGRAAGAQGLPIHELGVVESGLQVPPPLGEDPAGRLCPALARQGIPLGPRGHPRAGVRR